MSNNTPLVKGQIIYIKVKDCALLDKPDFMAMRLAHLQPHMQVAWLSQATKEFHQVKYGNLSGYIYFTNLSKNIYKPEYVPGKCEVCKGLGYLPVGCMDEAQWGNNFVHPVCPKCSGKHTFSNAYPSHGVGIKG